MKWPGSAYVSQDTKRPCLKLTDRNFFLSDISLELVLFSHDFTNICDRTVLDSAAAESRKLPSSSPVCAGEVGWIFLSLPL